MCLLLQTGATTFVTSPVIMYNIAGKIGREKVWQIWRIASDLPN